jgi:type I restriction enzyme R subunit
LSTLKTYYKVLHDLRNETSHKAPDIPDDQLKTVLHLTVAIYLYTTMINLRRLKSAGLAN